MLVGVNQRLLELAGIGRRAWPERGWPESDFAAEIERRGLTDLEEDRVGDVYLAWACAHGDAAALAAFEDRYGRDMVAFAGRAGLPPAFVDDVVQDVRRALFVAKGDEPPRIVQFSGRGDLRGWLRVTIVRQ